MRVSHEWCSGVPNILRNGKLTYSTVRKEIEEEEGDPFSKKRKGPVPNQIEK